MRFGFSLFFAIISFCSPLHGETFSGADDFTRVTRMLRRENGKFYMAPSSSGRGILQMKVGTLGSHQWKTVAAEGFGQKELNVACFELGFPRGASHTMESGFYPTTMYPQDQFVRNVNCFGFEDKLSFCTKETARPWANKGLLITCGGPRPDREGFEKLVGKFSLDVNGQASIEIWDGTIFNLVGPTREDLLEIDQKAATGRYSLFEGYRRGKAFEAVSWDVFPHGYTFFQPVPRPAIIEGEHTALVVRLFVNGVEPDATQSQIRSEFFGADGEDKWNINMFERCSHGSYKIAPFTGRYAGIFDTNGGVMDFQLGNVPGDDPNELGYLAANKLPYDDSVDFILFVIPDGYDWGSVAAAATLGGRFSRYKNINILNPFIVGHELGHNLGLHHSADEGDNYGDHTCLMGNGYVSNDLRKDFDENTHCFNNAKNWQLGWYADRRAQWSPSDGLQTFDLVGLGDYDLSNAGQTVVLEVDGKFYIGFNRISGVSSDVKEYQDLVTVQSVDSDKLSHLEAHLGSGDWIGFEGWGIYVERIDIKQEGQASIARIVVGTRAQILNDNAANNRPMNCRVNETKSAPACTEQCGSVPGIPQDDYPVYHGGSCAQYKCRMNDGLCVVGGICSDEILTQLFNQIVHLNLTSILMNDTYSFCERMTQIPEYVISNYTCFGSDSIFPIMVSDLHPFCAHNFSSNANIDEVEKRVMFSLTYTIKGTSKPEIHESSTQFSNAIFAKNVAELLGEQSVVANLDRVSDSVEVTIVTRRSADLENRVRHKWFLSRLQDSLQSDHIFISDLQLTDYAEKNNEANEDKDDHLMDNKLVLIGGALVVVLLIVSVVCMCCMNSSIQKKADYAIDV